MVVTSVILLSGCNSTVVPELISTDKEIVLSVEHLKDSSYALGSAKGLIQAITTDHVLVVAGTRGVILQGKMINLPAGSSLGLYTGNLNIFYLRDFVQANQKQFPILSTKPVQDAVLAQESWAKKNHVNLKETI